MNVIQQPFSSLQYSYNYSNVIKKKKASGKLYSCVNIREMKTTNNIPSSSFSVLTHLAQQVLAPVGAQL